MWALSLLLSDRELALLVPLLVVGLGLAIMAGIQPGRLLVMLATISLLPILAPVVEGVMTELPSWVAFTVLVCMGIVLLRSVSALLLGRRASDNMAGILAADLVRLGIALLGLPVRLFGRAMGSIVALRSGPTRRVR